ncbi:MAG: DNA translocase FtsK 4TM domain-containing protein, partial [Bacteroidales bacterium]|nr:DNA translocase FtsK 4TM domain-containing protein [Bacteroidales bacterium]
MNKKPGNSTANGSKARKSDNSVNDERVKFVFGTLLTGFAIYLLFALIAYIFWWKTDQSLGDQVVSGADIQVRNWSGKSGHWLAELLITKGFGLASFLLPVIIGGLGLYL